MTLIYILFALVVLVFVLILIGRAARRRQLRRDQRWETEIKFNQSDPFAAAPSVVKSRSAPSGAGDYSWAAEPSSRSGAGGVRGAFGSLDQEKKGRGRAEG